MTGTGGNYIYLLSSLPMLHFGAKMPLSFEAFLSLSRRLISEKDSELISMTRAASSGNFSHPHPLLKKWCAFETALRNEVVKIRATRKKVDPAPWLRNDGYDDPYISHRVMNAYRSPSVIERERLLDSERWHFLEEISFGHYFDLEALIVYALKLLILEKWEKVRTANTPDLIEKTAALT